MENKNGLKRRKSWFSNKPVDTDIEVLSHNNEDVQMNDSEEDLEPIDQSSPKLDTDISTSWIDTKRINDDLEELSKYVGNTSSQKKNRRTRSFQELIKPGSNHTENSSEEQINLIGEFPKIEVVSRPTSQGCLRRSVTPLRIRDNINHFLRLGPTPEKQEAFDEDTSNVFNVSQALTIQNKSRFSNLNGVPCSRLGLLDHNQCAAFMFQLNNIRKKTVDYAFYHDWVLWLEKETEEKKKEMYMERIIETRSDLKLAFKLCKKMMNEEPRKIHISKVGTTPRRLTRKLTSSGTVEFCVPLAYEYTMFKEVTNIIIDNILYKPHDIQRMYDGIIFLKNKLTNSVPICAISYKRLSSYTIISLWLYPPKRRESEQEIFPPEILLSLTECIRDELPHILLEIVDSAVFIDNKTLTTRNIYEKKLHQN